MVAVGASARGCKAKPTNYITTARYLGPSVGSCHDLCKKHESLEIKKQLVIKNKRVERNVERIKMTETKRNLKTSARDHQVEVIKKQNALPLKKIGSLNRNMSGNRKSVSSSTLNGSALLNGQSVRKSTKVNHAGSLPRKSIVMSPSKDQNKITRNKIKQLIDEKVTEMTEMTINETKKTKLELVPLTVEIIASSPTESTDVTSCEGSQSCSNKQVLEEENEHNDPDEVILRGVEYAIVTAEGDSDYRVIICKDEENGGLKVQFRKGEVIEVSSEDDGPKKLKFRRGKVLEANVDEESIAKISFKKTPDVVSTECESESETVNLKHQEVQERKEAQELLNRVIEETASKLVVNKKTKVRALVGAFESVISLRD
ncbi:hypothetical protein QVD17_06619 [Tagetes erecta]|uniref:Calmodulin-binding domain-containing protein n=1 Tax=Tagetes erecta TaxID=13708 RepID=A0AAD8LGC0_TARER|nr:hypothetical protein QVD17_06619 [Tagetes erecta]